jgi:hypothetical protein
MKTKIKRKKYDMGGQVPIEAEGGEFIQSPFGQSGQVLNGPSHAQGGVDVNVQPGTQIYSDRISIDGKTLAQRAEARQQFMNKLDKNPTDAIKRNTARRLTMEEALDNAITSIVSRANPPGKAPYGLNQFNQPEFYADENDMKSKGLRPYVDNDSVNSPAIPLDDSAPVNQNLRTSVSTTPTNSGSIPGIDGLAMGLTTGLSMLKPEMFQNIKLKPDGSNSGQYYQQQSVMDNPAAFDPKGASSTPGLTNDGSSTTTTTTGTGGGNTKWSDAAGGGMGIAGMGIQLGSSIGQAVAQFSNMKSMINTLKGMNHDNWTDYGLMGLQQQRANEEQLYDNRKYAQDVLARENQIAVNTQRRVGRQGALGINAFRAMDTASEESAGRNYLSAVGNLNSTFGNQLMTLGQEKVSQLNQMDEIRRRGQDTYDATNRQIAGDYYSGMSGLLADTGRVGRDLGRTLSGTASNYQALKYMGEMNPYFNYGFGNLWNK